MATHDELRTAIQLALPDVTVEEAFGELTVFTEPDRLLDVLRCCKDDELLACELLSDVSGVHWPAGEQVIERQVSTSGWPEYRIDNEDGAIEVLYVLRSITGGHSLRIAVRTPDDAPTLPSSTAVYPNAANFHEREVYDMFGVVFEGHPDLTRILMPEDWLGHPHRKDYPLGGVEIPYKNDKHIPPPHERDLREVVGSHASAAAAADATAAAEAAAEQDGGDQ